MANKSVATVVITISGGPGSGKSKTAASLATMLQRAGLRVESDDDGKPVLPFAEVEGAIANLADLRNVQFVLVTKAKAKI